MDAIAKDVPVLAIYDFRSKQEYIYRTNRMKEITGASELIAGMYARFIREHVPSKTGGRPEEIGEVLGGTLKPYDKTSALFTEADGKPVLNVSKGQIGIVVYEGGGNLFVLFRNKEEYKNANRRYSRIVMEKAYGLSIISACTPWPQGMGDEGFETARANVYKAFDKVKRIGDASQPTNVLPFTMVGNSTFQPIMERRPVGNEMLELSRESACKHDEFTLMLQSRHTKVSWKNQGKFIDDLGTKKGEDSLVAVLYFDGNSIGERIKHVLEGVGPNEYVQKIRDFSDNLHTCLVGNTEKEIESAIGLTPQDIVDEEEKKPDEPGAGVLKRSQKGYRVIVDHGDEITVICNAHAAPFALDAYFEAIDGTEFKACAGIAFCHAHDPFSEVYRIAEECCESGKKKNREVQKEAMEGLVGAAAREAAENANKSYVDFHFCRSGITGSLKQIRAAQESRYTARPYEIGDDFDKFLRIGIILAHSKVQRSDIKELSRAMLKGDSWYEVALERLKAKDPHALGNDAIEGIEPDPEKRKKILFDVASMWDVFDVRFASMNKTKGGNADGTEEAEQAVAEEGGKEE